MYKKSGSVKVVILEGVTTTGKTSVFNNLKAFAEENNLNWVFVSEKETIIPIIDSENQKVNNEHFLDLLNKTFQKKSSVYVFDRLHFSSIFKTHATINDLAPIEDKLLKFDSYVFMMHTSKEILRQRIIESMNYRDIDWSKYLLKKTGGSKDKVAQLYIDRQDKVIDLLKQSKLNVCMCNTDSQNFVKPTRKIIDILDFKNKI